MGKVVFGRRVLESAAIEERARRAMSGMAALGIDEGDSVALLLRNDIAFLEASIAIGALGAYAVPINWHAKPADIDVILRDSGAKLVIAHADLAGGVGDQFRTIAVSTPQALIDAYRLNRSACEIPTQLPEWESWLAAHEPWRGEPRRPRGSIAYTSGTTGVPKGIQRGPCTNAVQEAQVRQTLIDNFGIQPGMRALVCGPLYHSMQMANLRAAYDALGEEGLLAIEPRFDPETLLRDIEQHRITQILMVPIMFVRLLRLPEEVRRKYRVDSLEFVVHSAAPCPVDIKKKMIDWFGPVINEFFAQSETGAVAIIGSADALRKPGAVGRALSGCTIKILDKAGKELPPGEQGEIAVVNHAYPDFTYRNRPEARAALDRAGLIATGDIGYLDEEGFLFLCGRTSDMVISGGVNIFPAEIEQALIGVPGVADCAVFGIPDEEYGEVLAAHIQATVGAELDEAAVRKHLRERLASYMLPRVIRFETALPREDSGKIFKRRLRDPYWNKA